MHLARFPRARFAHLPTPLEAAPRLGEALGGLNLFIKRDDCTGLAGGVRQSDFGVPGRAVRTGGDGCAGGSDAVDGV